MPTAWYTLIHLMCKIRHLNLVIRLSKLTFKTKKKIHSLVRSRCCKEGAGILWPYALMRALWPRKCSGRTSGGSSRLYLHRGFEAGSSSWTWTTHITTLREGEGLSYSCWGTAGDLTPWRKTPPNIPALRPAAALGARRPWDWPPKLLWQHPGFHLAHVRAVGVPAPHPALPS